MNADSKNLILSDVEEIGVPSGSLGVEWLVVWEVILRILDQNDRELEGWEMDLRYFL